jgi:hypothetical protein
VTELIAGSNDLPWMSVYNAVRATLSSDSFEIHDRLDVPGVEVDVLLTVHDADDIIQQGQWDRATVNAVVNRHDGSEGRLLVGITAVGEKCDTATQEINRWIPTTRNEVISATHSGRIGRSRRMGTAAP